MNLRKKTTSFLLAGCIALSIVPAALAAETTKNMEQQANIIDSGTCGDNVRWTLDSNGTLTISGTGEMTDYGYGTGTSAPWFYNYTDYTNYSIYHVVIQSGVTSIGNSAFQYCYNLTNIEIPNSVTSIGDSAFDGCNISSIKIPNSVTSIGDSAFWNCESLTSIEIPNGVTSIRDYTFQACSSLTSIEIPNSVTSIGVMAFDRCYSLTNIEIPNNVTSIGHFAFCECNSLTDIEIPNSVTSIGIGTFEDCGNLKNIYFRGHAPVFEEDEDGYLNEFGNVKATVYYPAGDSTWTEDIRQDYGGNITWKTWNPSPSAPIGRFTDVPSNAYYADAVKWAVDKGITSGTSASTFSPNQTCTRAQAMMMLWRAMGSPNPSSSRNPFVDVKSSDYYYKAVLWAVQNNVSSGTSSTTFSPNAVCNRAQIMMFIWSAKGQPSSSNSTSFRDVSSSAFYYPAVQWAVNKGVTSGTTSATFSPNQDCTRAQIVTFLYKAMA